MNDISSKNGGIKKFLILISIIIGIVAGVIVGGFIPDIAVKFSILGEIFMNLLMMIVVPLVMLSMIAGICSLGDIRKLGAIGRRTVVYYFATTGISVFIGIILVNIIQPGRGISSGENHPGIMYKIDPDNIHVVRLIDGKLKRTGYSEGYVLLLRDQNVKSVIKSVSANSIRVKFWESIVLKDNIYIVSENGTRIPIDRKTGQIDIAERRLLPSGKGIDITIPVSKKFAGKKGDVLTALREMLVGDKKTGREGIFPRNVFNAMVKMEILPLIIFSLLIGAALSVLGERSRPAVDVINIFNDAVHKLVHWIMVIAPIGIFGIVAARIGKAGGFTGFIPELIALGKYSFTVLLGLAIHGIIVLSAILFLIGKRRPFRYMLGVGSALLNAFSTASSSATLPLTMKGIEEENGISERTSGFVLPIGATINMDGTALYEAVAAIFIAQVYGIELGPLKQVIIFITATLAAIGAAAIPEAGLFTMVIVLKAVGLPIEGIGLILTIDWLLDRFRTAINVWGDSVGAGVIEALEIKNKNI